MATSRVGIQKITVRHCGLSFVNGTYHIAGEFNGLPKFECRVNVDDDAYDRETIPSVLTIMSCKLKSGHRQWFISFADPDSPGTDKDQDYFKSKNKDEPFPPFEVNSWTSVDKRLEWAHPPQLSVSVKLKTLPVSSAISYVVASSPLLVFEQLCRTASTSPNEDTRGQALWAIHSLPIEDLRSGLLQSSRSKDFLGDALKSSNPNEKQHAVKAGLIRKIFCFNSIRKVLEECYDFLLPLSSYSHWGALNKTILFDALAVVTESKEITSRIIDSENSGFQDFIESNLKTNGGNPYTNDLLLSVLKVVKNVYALGFRFDNVQKLLQDTRTDGATIVGLLRAQEDLVRNCTRKNELKLEPVLHLLEHENQEVVRSTLSYLAVLIDLGLSKFRPVAKKYMSLGFSAEGTPLHSSLEFYSKKKELKALRKKLQFFNPMNDYGELAVVKSNIEVLTRLAKARKEALEKECADLNDLLERTGKTKYTPAFTDLSLDAIGAVASMVSEEKRHVASLEEHVLSVATRIGDIWKTGPEEKKNIILSKGGQDDIDRVALAITTGQSSGAGALLLVDLKADLYDRCTRRVAFWQDMWREPFECAICLEIVEPGQSACLELALDPMKCGHDMQCCSTCLRAYIDNVLKNKLTGVTEHGLRCIVKNCSCRISLKGAKGCVPNALFSKLRHFVREASVKIDPSSAFCSNVKCDKIIRGDSNTLHCADCGTKTCRLCGQADHCGKTCLEAHDQGLIQLKDDLGWQSCPKCGQLCEKIDGCDHMNCLTCETKFCYYCGASPWCDYNCNKRDGKT
jgi:hypothetical protein